MSLARNLLLMVGILLAVAVLFWLTREAPQALNVVVVAESREPVAQILEAFSQGTGLEVHLAGLGPQEALKLARKGAFDLLWTDSPLLAVEAQREGLLEPYLPPGFDDLVPLARDSEGYWFGVAARLKVLLVHEDLSPSPTGVEDLLEKDWSGKVALARPDSADGYLFWRSLEEILGVERVKSGLSRLRRNGAIFKDSDQEVAHSLATGEALAGLLYLDRALPVLKKGPFRLIFPDQGKLSLGTWATFSTVALIRGTPALPEARQLVAYLLSPAGQKEISQVFVGRLPTRKGLTGFSGIKPLSLIDLMAVPWEKLSRR